MTQVIASAERTVILDLTDVSFFDSAGLNVLLVAHREARRAGLELVLAGVPALVQQVLEMTAADQILDVFDTIADAEAALSSRQHSA